MGQERHEGRLTFLGKHKLLWNVLDEMFNKLNSGSASQGEGIKLVNEDDKSNKRRHGKLAKIGSGWLGQDIIRKRALSSLILTAA